VKGIGTSNPVSNRDDLPCFLWRNDKLAAEIHDIRPDLQNVPDSLDVIPVTRILRQIRSPSL